MYCSKTYLQHCLHHSAFERKIPSEFLSLRGCYCLSELPALISRYGRKSMILASYIMAMVFGFASAFANSYILFAVLRFLTGFGLTGISIISLVLSKLTSSPYHH